MKTKMFLTLFFCLYGAFKSSGVNVRKRFYLQSLMLGEMVNLQKVNVPKTHDQKAVLDVFDKLTISLTIGKIS
jgi:hypothetical protein